MNDKDKPITHDLEQTTISPVQLAIMQDEWKDIEMGRNHNRNIQGRNWKGPVRPAGYVYGQCPELDAEILEDYNRGSPNHSIFGFGVALASIVGVILLVNYNRHHTQLNLSDYGTNTPAITQSVYSTNGVSSNLTYASSVNASTNSPANGLVEKVAR